jgi:hypothetical protein
MSLWSGNFCMSQGDSFRENVKHVPCSIWTRVASAKAFD